MKPLFSFGFLAVVLAILVGCDGPNHTAAQLRKEIQNYSSSSTPEDEQRIRDGFQKLDAEITSLENHGKLAEARKLRDERNDLNAKFTTARVAVGLARAQNTIEGIGDAIKQMGEEIGQTLRGDSTPAPSEEEPE